MPPKQPWILRVVLAVASFTMWLMSFGFVRRFITGKIAVKRGKNVVEGKLVD